MLIDFHLEYWIEDDWYVGHLKDVPGVFSQRCLLYLVKKIKGQLGMRFFGN
jgi:hypothetical protein